MGLERLRRRGFNVRFTYHADALLNQDFPEASGDLEHVIREIELPITEMVAGGGGEAQVTQRLRRALSEIGWRKGIFHVEKTIGSFADLEAFGIEPTSRQRRAVGQLVERSGNSFGDCWANCFVRDKFGTATTHWAKLIARLDRGVGSPCPIVAIGVPISCVRS